MKRQRSSKEKRHAKKNDVRGGTTRLVSPQANEPAPETHASFLKTTASNGVGLMRPDLDELHVPDALIEASDTRQGVLMPGRFMLVVVGLAIVFIAIITWFVAQMPDKP